MNTKTIIGLIAFSSTVIYLMLDKKKSNGLQGVEVKINPQKLVNGALAMSNLHPTAKDGLRIIAENALNKYYGIK